MPLVTSVKNTMRSAIHKCFSARLATALVFIAIDFTQSIRAEEPAPAPIQQGNGHHFVCADYTAGKIFVVSSDGKAEWDYPAPHCDEIWALPNGNFLFNTGRGVKEVNRKGEVIFVYESKSEIYACQRLPDGKTFVAECNAGRLLEIAPGGRIDKEIRLLPEGKDGGHLYIRNARKLPNGHYLVCHYGEQAVKEYDRDGQLMRSIAATGGPHSAIRLSNGNTIVACGDLKGGSRLFEKDPKDTVVWEIKDGDLPGISLKLMTGFQRLPNGNTVMSNWLGHGHLGEAPHLIEVTPDKKVVWTFSDHKTMKTISSVQLLDVPGDATKFEIMH